MFGLTLLTSRALASTIDSERTAILLTLESNACTGMLLILTDSMRALQTTLNVTKSLPAAGRSGIEIAIYGLLRTPPLPGFAAT